ncbi:ABC-type transporter, ATPase component [Bdellovibrio bacteriovorus W]|nr:ABC-type transporter, ATPase component [Bdellovibrio bacteriovorus W]
MNGSNSYISAQSLSYFLPEGTSLFKDIHLTISPQTKYGLVGNNGVGKSTLARLLAGELTASSGHIIRTSDCTYLPQHESRSATTVAANLENLWESGILSEPWWQTLLKDIELETPISDLSGGQWTRVRILKALSAESGILILDEPTNNLDSENREIIYNFIRDFSGSLVVISHDKTLLQRVDIILELSPVGLTTYGGNYDFYKEESFKKQQLLVNAISSAKKEKKKAEKDLHEQIQRQEKRNRAGQAKAAKGDLPKILLGRRKDNAQKSSGNIKSKGDDAMILRQNRINDLLLKHNQSPSLLLHLPESYIPAGKSVFETDQFNIILTNSIQPLWDSSLSFHMQGSQHIAVRGKNGKGKSTLLKEILGKPADYVKERTGTLKQVSLPFALLDQDYSNLDPQKTVLENIQNKSTKDIVDLRNALALFQFFGEKVNMEVRHLSGGEKMKASLAQVLLQDPTPQLIVLDEPTNNLDIESTDILISALRSFEGGLIVISHDEAFLEEIRIDQEIILN